MYLNCGDMDLKLKSQTMGDGSEPQKFNDAKTGQTNNQKTIKYNDIYQT